SIVRRTAYKVIMSVSDPGGVGDREIFRPLLDHPIRRNSDRNRVGRDIANDHSIRANLSTVADSDPPDYLRSGPENDLVPDRGGPSGRNVLADQRPAPHAGALSDHCSESVI